VRKRAALILSQMGATNNRGSWLPWCGAGATVFYRGFACACCCRSYAETVLLEVRASNSAALALYESLCFERVGVRRKYYEASKVWLRRRYLPDFGVSRHPSHASVLQCRMGRTLCC